jgi:hypothetical protein
VAAQGNGKLMKTSASARFVHISHWGLGDREDFEASPHFRAFKIAGQRIGLFEPMMGEKCKRFPGSLSVAGRFDRRLNDPLWLCVELTTELVDGSDDLQVSTTRTSIHRSGILHHLMRHVVWGR